MNNDMTSERSWLSRNKFQELLEDYRSSLIAKRSAKTFINQAMYNDIKGLLEVWLLVIRGYPIVLNIACLG